MGIFCRFKGKKEENEGDNMTYPCLLRKKNVLIPLTKDAKDFGDAKRRKGA